MDNIQIVLVHTTHPGNIGAASRAMKTMGLSQLRLVRPKIFPCAEATARAAGADDILVNAQIYDTYAESLQDCSLIFGTSARQRSIDWPLITPKTCVKKALNCTGKVALVFGRESSGLTNDELDACHYLVQIPTNPDFSSLNVASAIQIMAYELQCASLQPIIENTLKQESAPASDMTRFYQHLEQTLIDIEFLDPEKPRRLMRRLHRLFNRIQPIDSEVRILRGVLTAMQKIVRQKK
ncbi:MAG: RNA methyltransferase [Thiomargarita sp.]|nr:RNA methyltransferase [Thiomargarita sp.]